MSAVSTDLSNLLTLDTPAKLTLIGMLWQSIDAHGQSIEMPDSLVEELDRRKAAAKRDPKSLIPWETIRLELGLSDG